MEESERSFALTDSDDYFLGSFASINSLSDFLSADVRFIYFADAIQLWFAELFNRVPDTVKEIPCCSVVDLEHPMKLMGRHPFFRLAKQVHSKEPFSERQMSIVKDSPSGHGELVAA